VRSDTDIDINEWVEEGINLIPSILDNIERHMSVPKGEDIQSYCDRLCERCDELIESGDRDTLLKEYRETEMGYAKLYNGLLYGDIALQDNPYTALSFIIRAIGGYVFTPDWRNAAITKHGARRAALASHAPHKANKQKARDWYAAHKNMTKDAAAQKIVTEGIVHASFRTVRGYLAGQ
jgi:hypothetical protein